MEVSVFTAEKVMTPEKNGMDEACKYGIEKSAEELATQMACGIRLGYFEPVEIMDFVFDVMTRTKNKIDEKSDLACAGFYAGKLNEALVELVRTGTLDLDTTHKH